MRLPNGYGSVTKLSGTRRRPYIVKKTIGYNDKGYPIFQIIGYAETREEGLQLLAKFNANPWDTDARKVTFAAVADEFLTEAAPKRFAAGTLTNLQVARKKLKELDSMPICDIRVRDVQRIIDGDLSCGGSAKIAHFYKCVEDYAGQNDMQIRQISTFLVTPAQEAKRERMPFTDAEVETLWEQSDTSNVARVALIYLYTGWRRRELYHMRREDIDLAEWIMRGGEKTKSGKKRVVPVHDRIKPFVQQFYDAGEQFIRSVFRSEDMLVRRWRENSVLQNHVIHETRHTFRTWLDNANANRKCVDMLMGHASKDVGERIYTHKTIEDLRETIRLLK